MLDILDVKGSVITMDALHCQHETLEIISDKKAHVVQVKKINPNCMKLYRMHFKRYLMHIKKKSSHTLSKKSMVAKKSATSIN